MSSDELLPWWERAIRDHEAEYGPCGIAWNISAVLERLRRQPPPSGEPSEAMVERVAIAMCVDDCPRRYGDALADDPACWAKEPNQDKWLQFARAAIAALPPEPSVPLVERATAWLYKREGGIAFAALSEADKEHWLAQGMALVAALHPTEDKAKLDTQS